MCFNTVNGKYLTAAVQRLAVQLLRYRFNTVNGKYLTAANVQLSITVKNFAGFNTVNGKYLTAADLRIAAIKK